MPSHASTLSVVVWTANRSDAHASECAERLVAGGSAAGRPQSVVQSGWWVVSRLVIFVCNMCAVRWVFIDANCVCAKCVPILCCVDRDLSVSSPVPCAIKSETKLF